MANQTIIAQKRNISKAYIQCALVCAAAAALFVVMAFLWRKKDPDCFTPYLCIAAALVGVAIFFIIIYFLVKRRPEVLIWYEDGLVKFYNGYACDPKDIIDIRSTYDAAKGQIAASGNITVITERGKYTCRRIRQVRLAYNTLISLKYGRAYMPEDLRVLMKRREQEKF